MRNILILFISIISCGFQEEESLDKVNGICLVAPPHEVNKEDYRPIQNIGANWVAIIPYAFCSKDQPHVKFDGTRQWYGETTLGIKQAILLAHEAGIKVMLKPHLWVFGERWPGDLNFDTQYDLDIWKQSYRNYLLHYARVAQELDVEMISIGTEIRQIANSNNSFWTALIDETREIYPGPLTYSSNWDNYENIPFWNKLDFIGIDAYFPVSESKTPSVEEVIAGGSATKLKIEAFAKSHLKKVLFTEFGYQSKDFCTAGHWEAKGENENVNLLGQANAYKGLFQLYWDEEWFAGGFAWKWHYHHEKAGGNSNSAFTPQNKLAEKILKNQYLK